MRPQVSWTTAEERRLIVDQALEPPGTVGMRFGACESLERLAEAGARVDREAGVARLPRELVERALAGCPREVLLSEATAKQDVVLDGSAVPDFGCSVAVSSRQYEIVSLQFRLRRRFGDAKMKAGCPKLSHEVSWLQSQGSGAWCDSLRSDRRNGRRIRPCRTRRRTNCVCSGPQECQRQGCLGNVGLAGSRSSEGECGEL